MTGKRKYFFILSLFWPLLLLWPSLGEAKATDLPLSFSAKIGSASRAREEDWRITRQRHFTLYRLAGPHDLSRDAEEDAGPIEKLDFLRVREWPNLEEISSAFGYVRDEQFLTDPMQVPSFSRRSTWLYPDDGCFARAALMKNLMKIRGYSQPNRVFIFGNLLVKSPNGLNGEVSWWYHTAPVARVRNQVYVFDPSIDPKQPILLRDWASRQTDDLNSIKMAFCAPDTYMPFSPCEYPQIGEDARAEGDISYFLDLEWRRQLELGRDPIKVLGDDPPW
ncbi:MAG: hypothetical protein IPJ71_10475 [Bdellovibrionales bacterium]|nr:hypothetical protein [Bdellovibrionales bacterium]